MDRVRFYLNGEYRELVGIDPTMTVLEWLRGVGLSGTKEGCNEGDCGACTLVLSALEDGVVRHRAVNGCLLFLPNLDGKALTTIEGLRAADGGAHPIETALVKHHASQCGYCTPGFAMALHGHALQGGGKDGLKDAIAGNLCRCTGYGPILAAGADILDAPAEDWRPRLAAIARTAMLRLVYPCPLTGVTKRYFAPRNLRELADLCLAHPDAILLAGGTDVGLWVNKQRRTLATVIGLGGVGELREVRDRGDAIEIGAGVVYADLEARIAELYPDFGEIIRRLGAAQVRNMATIGGNIANGSPIGDGPPALIALGATLVLRQGAAERRLALEDYFLDYGKQDRSPGEFVEKIILPKPKPGLVFRGYKISKRFDQDISAVLGAFAFEVEGERIANARLCFGGMAATPKRAMAAEAALKGEIWGEAAFTAAMAALDRDFTPLSDLRASAHYRMTVAKNLLYKAFLERELGPIRLAGGR